MSRFNIRTSHPESFSDIALIDASFSAPVSVNVAVAPRTPAIRGQRMRPVGWSVTVDASRAQTRVVAVVVRFPNVTCWHETTSPLVVSASRSASAWSAHSITPVGRRTPHMVLVSTWTLDQLRVKSLKGIKLTNRAVV